MCSPRFAGAEKRLAEGANHWGVAKEADAKGPLGVLVDVWPPAADPSTTGAADARKVSSLVSMGVEAKASSRMSGRPRCAKGARRRGPLTGEELPAPKERDEAPRAVGGSAETESGPLYALSNKSGSKSSSSEVPTLG